MADSLAPLLNGLSRPAPVPASPLAHDCAFAWLSSTVGTTTSDWSWMTRVEEPVKSPQLTPPSGFRLGKSQIASEKKARSGGRVSGGPCHTR